MESFFAIGDAATAIRLLAGRRALVSFAYVGTNWVPVAKLAQIAGVTSALMIDSGAFTAWRKGLPLDVGAYIAWLAADAPPFAWAIAGDVIDDAAASLTNWRAMPRLDGRAVPVFHEGEPVEHLDEYVATSQRCALGRIGGRRSESKTFEFYDLVFNRHPDAKFHALGNASATTLEPYPFASFDSTGWQRDAAYSNAARWPFSRCSKETRMRAYVEATESIEYRPAKQTSLFGRGAQ